MGNGDKATLQERGKGFPDVLMCSQGWELLDGIRGLMALEGKEEHLLLTLSPYNLRPGPKAQFSKEHISKDTT